jgi:hypothetical protein
MLIALWYEGNAGPHRTGMRNAVPGILEDRV